MKLTIYLCLTLFVQNSWSECVPAKEIIPYPADLRYVGEYHRVHPSGDYVMVSQSSGYGGEVAIIDISNREAAKTVQTPMINETYPVEGSWNLLASPNHKNGMNYFSMDDVLSNRQKTVAVFNDLEHNQYYHSSAELPGSGQSKMRFRTLLYSNTYRDYSVSFNRKGKLKDVEKSERKSACKNLGGDMSEPILSKDGTEIATYINGSMKVLKLKEDSTCEVVDDLGYASGKVSFSYPKAGKKGKVVFNGPATIVVDSRPVMVTGIFMYDRDTKITTKLSSNDERLAAYPGFTKDGRVIFPDRGSRKLIIVDPSQLNSDGSVSLEKTNCISVESKKKKGRR